MEHNTWIKISAIFGIITGLYWIFFRRSHSKSIQDSQIGYLPEENLKQLKQIGQKGFLSHFLDIQMAFIGIILILMYIPTFFPSLRKVIYTTVEFLVFSYFSVGASGLLLGTLLRKMLFGNIEDYVNKKHAFQIFCSNGNARSFPEISSSEDENGKKIDDPILKAMQKKCAIKAIICFVILYAIFLSSFFTLIKVIK